MEKAGFLQPLGSKIQKEGGGGGGWGWVLSGENVEEKFRKGRQTLEKLGSKLYAPIFRMGRGGENASILSS